MIFFFFTVPLPATNDILTKSPDEIVKSGDVIHGHAIHMTVADHIVYDTLKFFEDINEKNASEKSNAIDRMTKVMQAMNSIDNLPRRIFDNGVSSDVDIDGIEMRSKLRFRYWL